MLIVFTKTSMNSVSYTFVDQLEDRAENKSKQCVENFALSYYYTRSLYARNSYFHLVLVQVKIKLNDQPARRQLTYPTSIAVQIDNIKSVATIIILLYCRVLSCMHGYLLDLMQPTVALNSVDILLQKEHISIICSARCNQQQHAYRVSSSDKNLG